MYDFVNDSNIDRYADCVRVTERRWWPLLGRSPCIVELRETLDEVEQKEEAPPQPRWGRAKGGGTTTTWRVISWWSVRMSIMSLHVNYVAKYIKEGDIRIVHIIYSNWFSYFILLQIFLLFFLVSRHTKMC